MIVEQWDCSIPTTSRSVVIASDATGNVMLPNVIFVLTQVDLKPFFVEKQISTNDNEKSLRYPGRAIQVGFHCKTILNLVTSGGLGWF